MDGPLPIWHYLCCACDPLLPCQNDAAGLGESADTARISDRRLQKYMAYDERVSERKIHVVQLSLTQLSRSLQRTRSQAVEDCNRSEAGGGEERERQESAASGWAHRTVQLHTDSW